MPAFLLPALMTGLSALAGGLGNREQKQQQSGTSTTNSNSTSTQNIDQTSMPSYDPLQLKMRDFLINQFYNRTRPEASQGLVNNYIGQGVNTINQAAGQQEQALSAALAARGLSYSPASGQALGQQQSNRIGQITGLQMQAPLLQDQIQQGRLTDFSSFLSGLPTGTHTTGTNTTNTVGQQNTQSQGTVTTPGNVLGGAFGGAAGMLANLYGQGAFGQQKKKVNLPSNTGNPISQVPQFGTSTGNPFQV